MRTVIIKFFSIILCVSVIVSCSKKEPNSKPSEETAMIDFGEGVYRPNPFEFLDNVPPFSWLGMPDSVVGQSEITISFNEDAVRSKSYGTVYLADANGNRIEGIHIGDKGESEIDFVASDKEVTIPVTFRVNPEVGDSLLTGSIMVIADKLDVVNDTEVMSYATPVAGWQMKHQIGINWWRWLLLILVAALILAIIFLIGYGLVKAFIAIHAVIPPIHVSMPKFNRTKTKKKKKVQKKKLHWKLRRWQKILLNDNNSLHRRGESLSKLFIFLDYNFKDNKKDEQFKLLEYQTQKAIEYLWGPKGYYLSPKKNGRWTGKFKDSIWIPDNDFTPKDSGYNNEFNLTWGQIKKKYNFKGLRYKKGHAVFKPIARYSVKLRNFEEYMNPLNPDKRTSLHEAAFDKLSKKLKKDIREIKDIKENKKDKLVWHEDIDCKTLYLVPREIHDNLDHFGGIGIYKCIVRMIDSQ